MIEQDTIKLLRECDAGIKMGVECIDEVIDYVKNPKLRNMLSECSRRHEKLADEVEDALARFNDDGKDPNPAAEIMSWLKTNAKLTLDASDATIADLMTDGCNMGAKSLRRYINQYRAADEDAKDIACRLAAMEEQLTQELRQFL